VEQGPVASEFDDRNTVERLDDDREIVGPQMLIDEFVDRCPGAIAGWSGVDMEFVEDEPEDAGTGLARGPFLVSLGSNVRRWTGVLRKRPELNRLDRPRDTVIEQLEIRRPEIEDRPTLRVGHHRVYSNRWRVVGWRWLWLLRQGGAA
jgi:hypothetical protein